jgi:uncharacterized membrane protein
MVFMKLIAGQVGASLAMRAAYRLEGRTRVVHGVRGHSPDLCNTAERSAAMRGFKQFLKTTLVGGFLFLIPLILLILVLRHALGWAAKVAMPIAARFPGHEIAGVSIGTIVAALLLLLLAFLAGLAARTRVGKRVKVWFEDSLLGSLPQYRMVKTMAEGLAQVERSTAIQPALINLEGGWQLGYVLEEVRTGWVAVFLPQSPTPMSGNVMYLPAERVRAIDLPIGEAMLLVKRMGIGSAKALHGVALTPVPEG